jgi:hypothetical protein
MVVTKRKQCKQQNSISISVWKKHGTEETGHAKECPFQYAVNHKHREKM